MYNANEVLKNAFFGQKTGVVNPIDPKTMDPRYQPEKFFDFSWNYFYLINIKKRIKANLPAKATEAVP